MSTGTTLPRVRLMAVMATVAVVAALVTSAPAAFASGGTTSAKPSAAGTFCYGHRFNYWSSIKYAPGCFGHDEPELDPVSSATGSAQNLTWTAVLPKDGHSGFQMINMGPAFWFGAAVSDPNSLFGQAFEELQFYPDSLLPSNGCTSDGGFNPSNVANDYTVCSPVWGVEHNFELAVFNGELYQGNTQNALVMHGGDTITVHYYTTSAKDGFHITVTDVTTGQSGTIILSSPTDGPLMPAYSQNLTSNFLQWGVVAATPLSFSWEIGHTNIYSPSAGATCYPGQTGCYSYNVSQGWGKVIPMQIKGVTYGDGSQPQSWAVDDSQGGVAEVKAHCSTGLGRGYCTFPWYTYNSKAGTVVFGTNYRGTQYAYSRANQFPQQPLCTGPYGPDTLYCATTLSPSPPIG